MYGTQSQAGLFNKEMLVERQRLAQVRVDVRRSPENALVRADGRLDTSRELPDDAARHLYERQCRRVFPPFGNKKSAAFRTLSLGTGVMPVGEYNSLSARDGKCGVVCGTGNATRMPSRWRSVPNSGSTMVASIAWGKIRTGLELMRPASMRAPNG